MIAPKIGEAVNETLDLPRMVHTAQELCPVETGALKFSVRAERVSPTRTDLKAGGEGFYNPRTGKPVDYAVPVHEGTSKMPGRPFLRQAAEIERESVKQEIEMRSASKLE